MLHSRLAEGIQPVDGSLAGKTLHLSGFFRFRTKDYEDLCYEGVFRFFLPQHYIYDHEHQLVTVSHRLFWCDSDTQDNTIPSGNFVENESLLELATQIGENGRLDSGLWTINCYIRPSMIGVYLLYVFSKPDFYKHNRTDVVQIEFRRGEQKTEIASQTLDILCMLKIMVHKSWPNPLRFPEGSYHIWGRVHWNNSGFHTSQRCSWVETPDRGVVELRWTRLPVCYDLIVMRADDRTVVVVSYKPPLESRKENQSFDPILEEKEIGIRTVFTLRFIEYGEHVIHVYASRKEKWHKRRIYDLLGQYLFEVVPNTVHSDQPGPITLLGAQVHTRLARLTDFQTVPGSQ
ncbi:hypothetical protein PHET_11219 [Paragonimus heterotremus]|uniref:Uncharacterized protein n=1 Tax=Paragonimus heterotremus TaxID=100268 RepID=A0A8J4WDN7_9TREM|nr:hypothetical protein PHET_11219 [Paragonimus heterotremus]